MKSIKELFDATWNALEEDKVEHLEELLLQQEDKRLAAKVMTYSRWCFAVKVGEYFLTSPRSKRIKLNVSDCHLGLCAGCIGTPDFWTCKDCPISFCKEIGEKDDYYTEFDYGFNTYDNLGAFYRDIINHPKVDFTIHHLPLPSEFFVEVEMIEEGEDNEDSKSLNQLAPQI